MHAFMHVPIVYTLSTLYVTIVISCRQQALSAVEQLLSLEGLAAAAASLYQLEILLLHTTLQPPGAASVSSAGLWLETAADESGPAAPCVLHC